MKSRKSSKTALVFVLVAGVAILSMDSYTLLKTFALEEVSTYVHMTVDTEAGTEVQSKVAENPNTDKADDTGHTLAASEPTSFARTTEADTTAGGNMDSQSILTGTQAEISSTVTDSSYSDENIQINIDTIRTNDTTVYVADIMLSSAQYLKTALAKGAFGRNVTDTTSSMAQESNAILAVNGDYYGANDAGYVIRNGQLLRSTVRSGKTTKDLAIYADGSFEIIDETQISVEELVEKGAVNVLAFGPVLIQNGEIVVSTTDEVGKAMSENPRTAIGIIDENHYIIVVSDGRTSESSGLSLYELAQVMQSYNVKTAYNLDGGGSSTMYFNGEIINNPTTNGHSIKEREVSDIVYIGY